MRAAACFVALVALLGAVSSLWADPFSEVPARHWAYEECTRLASLGLLSPDEVAGFSGNPQLTRFEFALAILDPLINVEEAVRPLGADADERAMVGAAARALRLSPSSSEEEIARAAAGLLRLSNEFSDELRGLNLTRQPTDRALRGLADPEAVRAWRAEALSAPMGTSALAEGDAMPGALRVPFARGTVAFTLTGGRQLPAILDYLALSAATASADAPRLPGVADPAAADPAVADPRISRLRTAYEYGVGSALTLSLAYEEIARRGQGLAALDAASLASVGIGYQLTPSTSVKLSYSLLDYANHVFDTPPLRDRVAETAVSIEF